MDIDIKPQSEHYRSQQNLQKHNIGVLSHILDIPQQVIVFKAVVYLLAHHAKRHINKP